jgi:hypothetical protein
LAKILLSYQRHSTPRAGSSVHGYHLVQALGELGDELLTLEAESDGRLVRFPRSFAGMRRALAQADCRAVLAERCGTGPVRVERRAA